MTSIAGPLAGMKVKDAREAVIAQLESSDCIENIEVRDQEVPVSERGKNPVEIILLKEWYVRQTHIQERMREHADEINFIPPRNKQFLLDWMENVSIDWPISRRRWYHTEIPVWYSEDSTMVIVPPAGTYVQPWCQEPPEGSQVLDRETREALGDFSELRDTLGKITGEEKVFDTWMDSSLSLIHI